jgi:hypothetical protein
MFSINDDQTSLSSEPVMRPSSFRPSSASKPDFILPKDVQFLFQNREKVQTKLERFYAEEKKGIEEMIDECLKTIITLFEEHKKRLFEVLDQDKQDFQGVYSRFCENIESFVKASEFKLSNNLKDYETKVMNVHTDEHKPLNSQMEKLRLDRDLINSQEKLISQIISNYEKSSIPSDKKIIDLLMVDGHKKMHAVNVASMASHMQSMIGTLKKQTEEFKNYQKYTSSETPNTKSQDKTSIQESPLKDTVKSIFSNSKVADRESVLVNNIVTDSRNLNNNQNVLQSSFYHQQLLLQNMKQLGISPDMFENQNAYKMFLLNQQLNFGNNMTFENKKVPSNYVNQNYEGAIVKPHISGNLNVNINALQNKNWQQEKEPLDIMQKPLNIMQAPMDFQIRSALKTQSPKRGFIQKGLTDPKGKLIQKKVMESELDNSQLVNSKISMGGVPYMNQKQTVNNILTTFGEEYMKPGHHDQITMNNKERIDRAINDFQNMQEEKKRATSPIIQAKESVHKLRNIYEDSKKKVQQYRQHANMENKSTLVGDRNIQLNRNENTPRTSVPVSNTFKEDSQRHGVSNYNSRGFGKNVTSLRDAGLNNQKGSNLSNRLQSKRRISNKKFEKSFQHDNSPTQHEKISLKRKLLQPKNKLDIDIKHYGSKYGGKWKRPSSQNVKSFNNKFFTSKK